MTMTSNDQAPEQVELSASEHIAASIALGIFPAKCTVEEALGWKLQQRSFPEAGDGRPQLPMEEEIWAAGADLETAKFVARMLAQKGLVLIQKEDIRLAATRIRTAPDADLLALADKASLLRRALSEAAKAETKAFESHMFFHLGCYATDKALGAIIAALATQAPASQAPTDDGVSE